MKNKKSETGFCQEIINQRHFTQDELKDKGVKKINIEKSSTQERSFEGVGPRGFKIYDNQIKDNVCGALYRCSIVDASKIEVFVVDGRVRLVGEVLDWNQKRSSEAVVSRVAGVKEVINELRIKNKNPQSSRFGLIDNITGLN